MAVMLRRLIPLLALPLCATPAPLLAQEVVQALPDPASAELAEALRRLSRNPESVPALVAAGRASLALDDIDAATGFYARAQRVAPRDGRVLAGMGLIALRQNDAPNALRLFSEAESAGESLAALAAERGLAYDLVGNNARAQRLYRQALESEDAPETVRRLALSYAISGDSQAAEQLLLPLMQRQDRAAFRTRAFALAIAGRTDEAVTIVETMLPQRIAQRLVPYMRYMPRLTRAQQAAAANLGRFPAASQIGREDPQLAEAAAASQSPPPAPRRGPDSRLEPAGAPLGPSAARAEAASVRGELPPSSPPAVARRAPEPVEELPDLAEAFADFALADDEAAPRPRDAVDITRIDPPRERPAPPKPTPPAHPSRHWVQVATGRDLAAFRFDWRRLKRSADGLLDDRKAYHARWGQTNRLLTGPFDSAEAAQDFVTELAKAGVDAFRFTSETGEEVASLQ